MFQKATRSTLNLIVSVHIFRTAESSKYSTPDLAVLRCTGGCFPAALDADSTCPCAHRGKEIYTVLPRTEHGAELHTEVQFRQNCHVSLHPSCVTRQPGYLGLAHLSLLLSHQRSLLDVRKFTSESVRISDASKKVEMLLLVKTWFQVFYPALCLQIGQAVQFRSGCHMQNSSN